MKWLKKLLLTLLAMIVVFFVFLVWYNARYSMDQAKAFEMNSPNLDIRLLIATQGSDFKNEVTNGIVAYYEQDSIFIKVIDISDLGNIVPEDFNALIVVHTWENWKPPKSVQSFIEKHTDIHDKMVVLTTSGQGSYKMDNVDAITGESKVKDAQNFVNRIVERLNPLLRAKT